MTGRRGPRQPSRKDSLAAIDYIAEECGWVDREQMREAVLRDRARQEGVTITRLLVEDLARAARLERGFK